jgi:hypothetical protein
MAEQELCYTDIAALGRIYHARDIWPLRRRAACSIAFASSVIHKTLPPNTRMATHPWACLELEARPSEAAAGRGA